MPQFMFLVMSVVVAAIGLAAPAAAIDDVTVTLEVAVLETVPFTVPTRCDLEVPSGSDGIDVLEEALDEYCIVSYDTVDFGGELGEFVTCINELCGQSICVDGCTAGSFWALLVDGMAAEVGVSNMSFTDGAVLGFDYDTWGV